TIYAEIPPRLLRWLGKFDVTPEARPHELDVWLLAGEIIRPDAGRLFRSRPGASRWQNPLAEKDGQPGVVFRWLEVEGPIFTEWPTVGHKLLFGDLPLVNSKLGSKGERGTVETNRFGDRKFVPPAGVEAVSKNPMRDAQRLLAEFIRHAYRQPVTDREMKRFLPVVDGALKKGNNFTDAMLAGY